MIEKRRTSELKLRAHSTSDKATECESASSGCSAAAIKQAGHNLHVSQSKTTRLNLERPNRALGNARRLELTTGVQSSSDVMMDDEDRLLATQNSYLLAFAQPQATDDMAPEARRRQILLHSASQRLASSSRCVSSSNESKRPAFTSCSIWRSQI